MKPDIKPAQHNFENAHVHWRKHLKEMSGDQDIRGIEIGSAIRMLANCYESAISQNSEFSELSGPRMAILMRLMVEEDMGAKKGINPTLISKFQNVSKNTISSLLRGLEEQSLIERTIDPDDRRGFLIRITPAGRDLVRSTGPTRLEFMNRLASGLSGEDRDQLLALLEKLRGILDVKRMPSSSQRNK